ncbi:MAG: hypothetical protein AAFX87_25315 [Bacteroidota bacterium]
MKILFLLFLVAPICSFGQTNEVKDYLKKYANTYQKGDFEISFGNDFAKNDLIFFGYIHGSEAPQMVEFEMLRYVVSRGFRYYAPEIGVAQAYFLNQYLKEGDEALLRFVTYYQKRRTPQDASVQFIEKWRKIYKLNRSLPDDRKITVLGTDISIIDNDPSLMVTYLAHIAPENTGNAMIDSLKYFRNLDILDLQIWSGAPVLELAKSTNKSTHDFVYPISSKYQFGRRFLAYYSENKTKVLEAFRTNRQLVEYVLSSFSWREREDKIAEQFEMQVMPMIQKGEKVFSVFGYAHVLQGPINGKSYLAGIIKEKYPNLEMASVLGLLAKSKALKKRKYCKSDQIEGLQGFVFDGMEYCGYKVSSTYDGDGFGERLLGIQHLKRATKGKDILTLPLVKAASPFGQGLNFIGYKKGGKQFKLDPKLSTIDHFQYLIYMQHSEANVPFEELNGG